MAISEARWVVSLTGLLILVLVSVYVVKLVRDMALGSGISGSADYLTDFQKLRDEGKLDDDEYSRLAKSIPTAHSDGTDQSPKQDPLDPPQVT